MGLRAKLLLAFAVIATLGVGTSLVAVDRYLLANERLELYDDLEHASAMHVRFESERGARRAAETRVVAEEPRLKAVMRTTDIDRETLEDVADELRQAMRTDLFALLSRTGEVAADVSVVPLEVDDARRADVAAAMRDGSASPLWLVDGRPFQMVIRPLRFGVDVAGFVVVGYRVDDAIANEARELITANLGILAGGKLLAAGLRPELSRPAVEAAFVAAPTGTTEQPIAGERFIVRKAKVRGSTDTEVVLARSLDQAMIRYGAVRRILGLIGVATLLLAFLVALRVSRSLTLRIESLAGATRKLAAGDWSVRARVEGTDEVARLATAFNGMTEELERSQQTLADKQRLEREMQIAQRIQSALLPRDTELEGYAFAATMLPAESVGGDYYDLLKLESGRFWLAIGDVTSHGVTPGLIMMMAQTAVATLAERDPTAGPRAVLGYLNRVLHANIHERLKDDNHMTLCLMKETAPGRFVFAGAHLDIVVRRKSGQIERVPTPGMWVGVLPEIEEMLEERTLALEPGDLMVLYTDGLTEARSADGALFDLDGLERVLAQGGDARQVCGNLVAAAQAHMKLQDDDITVVALERLP